MSTSTQPATTGVSPAPSRGVLQLLAVGYTPRDFTVRFWDGSVWEAEGESRFTLILKHPGSVRAMFNPFNQSALGEAYIYDDFDLEGDAVAFMRWLRHIATRKRTLGQKANLIWKLSGLPKDKNARDESQASSVSGTYRSLDRDKQAISYHYDMPPEFFQTFLDSRMQYSCAYFRTPEDDLETVQTQKLDLICKKLRLQPGERLLDVGFGWGGLLMYAAKHYGVEGVGISISKKQIEYANRAIREAGLQDKCRVEFRDYRELPETEPFDKAVSVSVVEHFGERMMPVFFNKLWKILRPKGVYLHHCITLKNFMPYPRWTTFARKYVFPDGEVRPLETSLRAGEQAGFEIRDIESLREHYQMTLRLWLQKLEENHDEAVRLTNEVRYRVFRLYLAGACEGFRIGNYQLYQTLFVKPDDGESGFPLTREDWYS